MDYKSHLIQSIEADYAQEAQIRQGWNPGETSF